MQNFRTTAFIGFIRAVLCRHNLTTEQFSDMCGVSRVTVSNWINGKGKPAVQQWHAIADSIAKLDKTTRENILIEMSEFVN